MSRIQPLLFQQNHIDVLVRRFHELRLSYDALGANPDPVQLAHLRRSSACVLLQAPTGIGKTLMACELMASFSPDDKVLWLWFAPFTGVLSQAKATLKAQAPSLTQLDLDADRQVEKLTPGAIFVLSWQTVATKTKESRLARLNSDGGMAIDGLIAQARAMGYRIGVVVDEAHHGFVKAPEAGKFFSHVLAPEYVLLMTATPRDGDAVRFAEQTGYRIGGPSEWASVTRAEGVDAQLLKLSVKAARFISPSADDAALIEFEEVALSECAAMHRLIKSTLAVAGIGLTPLMLVQVPNGAESLEKARDYLISKLRFPETAVRSHTAEEPDPKLTALANDPAIEVILFKMALATGFDAPRAFTLAALRGTRDRDFGIQVVGRIMRVHRLLQGRMLTLPPVLRYGYVFLANSSAQEGLLDAAAQINAMPGQLASASPSTVVTLIAGEPSVQVALPGQSLTLLPQIGAGMVSGNTGVAASAPSSTSSGASIATAPALAGTQAGLFQGLAVPPGQASVLTQGFASTTALTMAFELDAQSPMVFTYSLKPGSPASFVTEHLPKTPDDLEHRLASLIDFGGVLGDRFRVKARLVESTQDVFTSASPDYKDVWATVSAKAIAEKARQIALEFVDVDRRELLSELKARFREAIINGGQELPETEEDLTRQLELVLVRNQRLVRDAHKRLRAEQVTTAVVHLPLAIVGMMPLTPAKRNVFGVFPEDMSPQEREFAELLDSSKDVIWWHRNSVRKPDSVALYRWNDGIGFFPDYLVGVAERTEGDGIALSEVKGPQLQQYDKLKAGAVHARYGRVFMAGKTGADGGFRLWRLANEQLVDDGPFEVQRMRFS